MNAAAMPEAILRTLRDHTDADVVSALRTAGRWPFGALGMDAHTATPWVVVCPDALWVVAAADVAEDAMAWSWCDHAGVRVERGWVRDVLVVGPERFPLPRKARDAAEALVATWRAQPADGTPQPRPTPMARPSGRARTADAGHVPAGWARDVPADPGDRWLVAVRTAGTHPLPSPGGEPEDVPVWIGVTDRGAALVALDADGVRAWRALDGALEDDGSGRRFVGGGVVLEVGRRPDRWLRRAVALLGRAPADRWARLAEAHLDDGDARAAAEALREAHALRRGRAALPTTATLAWLGGAPEGTRRVLVRALQTGALSPTALPAWAEGVATRPLAAEEAVRTHLATWLDALEVPPPPEAVLLPPERPGDVGVAALLSVGEVDAAREVVRTLPEGPATLALAAAVREHADPTSAPAAWRTAAEALREAGRSDAGRAALQRARARGPHAADAWRLARWCWEDGAPDAAADAWRAAIAEDAAVHHTPGPLPPEAWATLAALADAEAAPHVARHAWRALTEARPDDADAAWQAAHREVAGPTPDHEAAARRLTRLAEDLEEERVAEAGHAPWEVWIAAADLQAGAARQASLRRAAAAGFLHAAAWEAILARAADGPDAAWWRHLQGAVTASPEAPRPPERPRLDADALAALAVRDRGLLGDLRRWLDGEAPPPRATLIRGLEPLEQGHADLAARVADLSWRLGLPPVDAFVFRGADAYGASAWPLEPPILLVGHDHLVDGPRRLDPAALDALLAVELAHLACEHPMLDVDASLQGTSRQVYRAFGRFAGTAETLAELLTLVPGVDQISRLERLVRTARKVGAARVALDRVAHLTAPLWERLVPSVPPHSGLARDGRAGLALQLRQHADRCALALLGDLGAATRAILASSPGGVDALDTLRDQGLAAVLDDAGGPLRVDELVRLTALAAFAAQEGPFVGTEGA